MRYDKTLGWFAALSLTGALTAAGCQLIGGGGDFEFHDGPSAGGGGTAPDECMSIEQCPGVDVDCSKRSCIDGMCGINVATEGTVCDDDDGQVCNDSGKCVACNETDQCTGDDE